jgi:hypothetical protein
MNSNSDKIQNDLITSTRLLAGLTVIILAAASLDLIRNGSGPFSLPIIILVTIVIGFFILGLGFLFLSSSKNLKKWVNLGIQWLFRMGFLKWPFLLLACLMAISFSLLAYGPASQPLQNIYFRLALLWLLSLLSAFFLKVVFPYTRFIKLFLLSILISAAIFQSAGFFRDLTTYLFSLAWSEGSRFYYASLPFSPAVYGQAVPWSFLHPARYLLMSLPFLFGNLPLWFHRGWQIFLWIFITGLGCLTLVRRLKPKDHFTFLGLVAWGFIFFMQGPFYYHLMICAILVLSGFDAKNLARSLAFILLASFWAGICRVNWFPVPAALAILLHVLEKPYDQSGGFWKYLRNPVLFGLAGIGASLAAQTAYIPISGNLDTGLFISSFSSDLLWYRLFPSPTYPVGILTGLILLISPLLVAWLINFKFFKSSMHRLRILIIGGILVVFLVGGLVVSVKIGGGSNLHNLDAFFLLLTVFIFYLLSNRIGHEKKSPLVAIRLPAFLVMIMVMVPISWAVFFWEPYPVLDKSAAYQDLQRLTETVLRASAAKQEVLFISERQLLTFHNVKDVSLVPDYELLTLMEMAISHNQQYLDRFYTDLQNQRFGLIIMDKQYVVFKDSTSAFPEENNAWVKSISIPILQYYQPITWLRDTGTEIYAPRDLSAGP